MWMQIPTPLLMSSMPPEPISSSVKTQIAVMPTDRLLGAQRL